MRASDIPNAITVTSTLDGKLMLAGLLTVPAGAVDFVLDLSKLRLDRREQAYRAICGAVKAGTLKTAKPLDRLPDESPRGYVVRDTHAPLVADAASVLTEKVIADKAAADAKAKEEAEAAKAKAAADAAAKAAAEEAELEAATRPQPPVATTPDSEIL